ncbi:hypothetical protein BDV38DRAFT_285178 [Aspergillus pseudotamarii]|uniref:Ricin B lectin domain-containing protein n=1 Tax=Aspergillus pseudotamarii TaxID=132259 RepID=A0A5N6SP97_ASPPS|nr:uncharacterized protein BDV38DRAFT_285178 [Aspergillus pseudotamarii]KAE8135173.1 hypothetical protein BDV38DRAFT_285178 [Aspergillus pseudotamarii]
MQFSFSIVALIALGGQALAQSATGNYVVTESGDALTANEDGQVIFSPVDSADDQIWGFNSVGPDTVVIQNQASGNYLNCDASGTPCTTSADAQIFEPIKRGTDLYQIADESGDLFLAESSDKTIHLVLDVPAGEKTLFTLTRPTECEL